MKTLEEKMAAVQAEHEKELEKQQLRLQIVQRLPTRTDVEPEVDWNVFVNALYDRVASVTRKTDDYTTRYKGALPWSIEDLAHCLGALPPMHMVKAKVDGTFTSFCQVPVPKGRKRKVDGVERDKFEVDCSLTIPLTLDLEPGNQTATFSWFHASDIGIIEVNYPIPWQHKWMRHNWRRVDYHGGFRYDGSGSGIDIDLPYSTVKWGRGGREYMGKTTVYWTAQDQNLGKLLAALRQKSEETNPR